MDIIANPKKWREDHPEFIYPEEYRKIVNANLNVVVIDALILGFVVGAMVNVLISR